MTLWWKEAWCPYCQAPPGQHCVSKTGKRVTTHADRHAAGAYEVFGLSDEYDADEYDDYSTADLNDLNMYITRPPSHPAMVTVYLPGDAPEERVV